MQNFIASLSWKKLAALAILFSIIMLAFVLASFMGLLDAKKPGLGSENTRMLDNPKEIGTTKVTNKTLIYKNSLFQVSYPSNFSVSEGVINDKDVSVSFSSDAPRQAVEIQVYSDSNVKLSNLLSIFRDSGYVESSMLVDGQNASYFNGAIMGLMERVIVFEYNSKVFKIQFSYKSNNPDTVLDKNFTNMISTFRLLH